MGGDVIDIKSILDPCLGVLGDYYGVLHMVVDAWRRGEEATLYSLSEEAKKRGGAPKSRGGMLDALRSLTRCGYLMRLEAGERGKKLYLPTPLGILVDLVVGLLHPEVLGVDLKGADLDGFRFRSCIYADELLSKHLYKVFVLTRYGHTAMLPATDERGGKIDLAADLARGYVAAKIALDMVCMELWIRHWADLYVSPVELRKHLLSLEQDLSDAIDRLAKEIYDLKGSSEFERSVWEAARLFMRSYESILILIDSLYRVAYNEIILGEYENIFKEELPRPWRKRKRSAEHR
jgi:hypothetical protein